MKQSEGLYVLKLKSIFKGRGRSKKTWIKTIRNYLKALNLTKTCPKPDRMET